MSNTKYKFIIAIDPSGNFNKDEKGGTGIAVCYYIGNSFFVKDLTIWAKDHKTKKEYYDVIIGTVFNAARLLGAEYSMVVIEDFRLQAGKASKMSNKTMETSELIGIVESKLDERNIEHRRQQNTIKSRWPKKLVIEELAELGVKDYKPSSRHAWDAMRHALNGWFFTRYKEKKL